MFAIVHDKACLGPWLEERRRLGLDRRDECWEGVLHMNPEASFGHNAFVIDLSAAFRAVVRRHDLGTIGNTNVRPPGTRDQNYRAPDIMFVAHRGITKFSEESDVWIEHGPDFIVEVLSPGDQTMKKLAFYAERGIPEILICERDTRRPLVLRLGGNEYVAVGPDPEGGLAIECLRVRLFYEPSPRSERGKLRLKDDRTGEWHEV